MAKVKPAVKKKKITKARSAAKKAPKSVAKKKAPRSTGIPKKDLKPYKLLLIKEREKIGGELSHIAKESLNTSRRDASGDLSGYSYHMADVASDNYEMEFSLGRATDEQKALFAIDEALRRMVEGTYGCCLQCSKLIAKKRLQALPQTALCIECQKANEDK